MKGLVRVLSLASVPTTIFITSRLAASSNRDDFVIDVLLPCAAGTAAAKAQKPSGRYYGYERSNGKGSIVPVRLSLLTASPPPG